MANQYGLNMTMDDYYWAEELDETVHVHNLSERIYEYGNYLRNNQLWRRVLRNLRYYYDLYYDESTDSFDMNLKSLGDEGELVGCSVNHFRNLIKQYLSMVTQNRPAWDTRAINTELKSLEQARLGDNILEYYMREGKFEKLYYRLAETAVVMLVSYLTIEWDPSLGREVAVMEGDGVPEGDVHADVKTPVDMVYDITAHKWEEVEWVIFRERVNRWNLAAQYPDMADEILMYQEPNEPAMNFMRWHYPQEHSDMVSAWKFYHKRTEALPEGRYTMFLNDTVLIDTPLQYKDLPVIRLSASEMLMTCFGYSFAMDLQSLQEALNSEISSILTNHKSFSVQNIWVRSGTNVHASQLDGGLNLIESDEKPEPLNLLETQTEVHRFVDVLMQHMEYISGINSVARGQPEASLKSGSALALIDAKAVQFASDFHGSYIQSLEEGGTKLLRTIRDYASTQRIISVLGRNNRASQQHFSGGDLDRIDRVVVQSGNALTRTLSGRVEIATHLLQQNLIRTPEEYLTVIQTGQLDSMLNAETAQLELVHSENERLREGAPAFANALDYHVLHIREHQAILNSPEIRLDNQLMAIVEGHIMEHMELLMDPIVQAFQVTLGFPVTIPPLLGGPVDNQMMASGSTNGTSGPGAAPGPNPTDTLMEPMTPQPQLGHDGVRPAQMPRTPTKAGVA